MSSATAGRFTSARRSWGWKASFRSALTRNLPARPLPRPGPRPRRCRSAISSSPATPFPKLRKGSRRSALGEWEDGELQYRGKVGTGFDAGTARALLDRLEPLRAGADQLDGAPKEMIWVRPVLSAHIHYANRTADNSLRHAVFKGLRDVELSAAWSRASASG